MNQKMFEAHVQFELDQWPASVTDEVQAAFAWLATIRAGDVLTPETVLAVIDGWPGPDVAGVQQIHEAALQDQTRISDLVQRSDYDRLAGEVMGLGDVQEAAIEQVTTSEVYAELITHVLYHGIKNYVMTESPVAKVPGASAFMKFGQNAMDRGVPKLSKGIDRQLMAFVNANIQDSLRESQNYLTSVVDESAMSEVAGEIWNRNAEVTVSEVAALIPQETAVALAGIALDMWDHLRDTEAFRDQVSRWLDDNAERSVADLLADAGVTSDQVVQALDPWLTRAVEDGYLEARIRARLQPFYESFKPAARRS